jgi:methyltransferase-like protein
LTLLERCLLPLLDGAHSHDALAEHLAKEAQEGRLRFVKDDQPITEGPALRDFTRQQVMLGLRDLRRKALVVG